MAELLWNLEMMNDSVKNFSPNLMTGLTPLYVSQNVAVKVIAVF